MVGSMLLFVLKVLNISKMGMIATDSLKWKARCKRQSKEKNSLFLRRWLRPQSVPFTTRVSELLSLHGAPDPSPSP